VQSKGEKSVRNITPPLSSKIPSSTSTGKDVLVAMGHCGQLEAMGAANNIWSGE
jgi:hypothetical protein